MIDTLILVAAVLAQGSSSAASADSQRPYRPAVHRSGYVSEADYPREALRRGEQGTIEFELDVSSEGRATACRIIASDAGETLNQITCDLMLRRTRFRPARNREGRAVSDIVRSHVRWVLPD